MTYTIATLAAHIERELHGRTTDRLQDVYETAYQAGLILLSHTDPKETQRTTQITPQVFDDVTLYASPADFKAYIDVHPNNGVRTQNTRVGQNEHATSSNAPLIAEQWRDGARYLLIKKYPQTGRKVVIENFDTTDGLTTGGDAGALSTNALNTREGATSIETELSGATGTATIEKTVTTQDLSVYRLLSSWFLHVYIPAGQKSRFVSFTLKHGNSDGVDWGKTVTTQHNGAAFNDGWNLLRFDWSTATQSGSVDETAMDYMKITITYSAGTAIPGVLLDNLNIQMGDIYDLDYYSNYLFMNSSGTFLEKPSDATDIIALSSDSYNLYASIASMLACKEVRSLEKEYERLAREIGYPVDPRNQFAGTLGMYRRMNPSERPILTTQTYNFSV